MRKKPMMESPIRAALVRNRLGMRDGAQNWRRVGEGQSHGASRNKSAGKSSFRCGDSAVLIRYCPIVTRSYGTLPPDLYPTCSNFLPGYLSKLAMHSWYLYASSMSNSNPLWLAQLNSTWSEIMLWFVISSLNFECCGFPLNNITEFKLIVLWTTLKFFIWKICMM